MQLSSLFGLFTCCTRSAQYDTNGERLADELPGAERVAKCIFCDVRKEKGFDVVWEDETYIVFNDYRPAAKYHLLVIPKKHVASVKSLTQKDVALVREMADIGHRMLDERDVPQTSRRLGFHIPPFNSVKHLHLHVQAQPYTGLKLGKVEYPVARGRGEKTKGFSWFAEVEQTISILEKGGKVGLFAC